MNDRAMQALVLALVLILPISALVARRMPMGVLVRYGLTWGAIFVAAVMIVAYFT